MLHYTDQENQRAHSVLETCVSVLCVCRLPRSLIGSPLRPGDDILEINGVPIVDQDQKEVCVQQLCTCACKSRSDTCKRLGLCCGTCTYRW